MRNPTQISASNLGLLAYDKACPFCIWLMLIVGSNLPYRFPFPGVMFKLDRLEKNIVEAAIQEINEAPSWLGNLAGAESVLPPQSLRHEHESGMTVIGKPDAVFEMPDGTLGLVDYKTAAFRGEDDPLFTKYVTQLSTYALLLEKKHSKKVSEAGLVYFEANDKPEGQDLLPNLTKTGLLVDFSAHCLPVEIDTSRVDDLLEQAYKLATANVPPTPSDSCQDCRKLSRLTGLLDSIEHPIVDVDSLRYLNHNERLELRSQMASRRMKIKTSVQDLLDIVQEVRELSPSSVIGQWNFDDDAAALSQSS